MPTADTAPEGFPFRSKPDAERLRQELRLVHAECDRLSERLTQAAAEIADLHSLLRDAGEVLEPFADAALDGCNCFECNNGRRAAEVSAKIKEATHADL